MTTISWKVNRLFSLRLKDGRFALLQMLAKRGQVAVFNCFRDSDEWSETELDSSKVLFYSWILRSVLRRSDVSTVDKLACAKDLAYPDHFIDVGSGTRRVVLWHGKKHEREIVIIGEGNNLLRKNKYGVSGKVEHEYAPVARNEYESLRRYELSNLRDYPEFNERLYLCSLFNTNIDPLRDLAFDQDLPEEFSDYIDIISGKVDISNLGY